MGLLDSTCTAPPRFVLVDFGDGLQQRISQHQSFGGGADVELRLRGAPRPLRLRRGGGLVSGDAM